MHYGHTTETLRYVFYSFKQLGTVGEIWRDRALSCSLLHGPEKWTTMFSGYLQFKYLFCGLQIWYHQVEFPSTHRLQLFTIVYNLQLFHFMLPMYYSMSHLLKMHEIQMFYLSLSHLIFLSSVKSI